MTHFRSRNWCVFVASLLLLICVRGVRGEVLIDIDWEEHEPGTLLNTIPGWEAIPGSANNPVIQVDAAEPDNKFLTTGPENNQATRDALTFTNPGFFSGTTLTFTVDMFDPLLNTATAPEVPPSHTFPRAYLGIMERRPEGPSLPSYFGMEHDDNSDDPTTAEWVVAGEDFGTPAEAPQMYSGEGSIEQDTWYTVRSVWDLGANTKSLEVKQRDSADPFTTIFSDVPIGFLDPDQPLHLLNSLAMRMNRGTRIDNILVEYDVVMAPGTPGDYNDDGTVDAADYVVWRDNEGQTVTLPNDTTGNPTVGIDQYNLWQANFGNPPASAAGLGTAIVPEPTTLAFGTLCVLSALLLSRRSAKR